MENRYEKSKLTNDLKYLQMYIGELLTGYELNEAICDFYDCDKVSYIQFGTCLGFISSSLKYRIQMLGYLLFSCNNKTMNINKVLNKIIFDFLYEDKTVEQKIKQRARNLQSSIEAQRGEFAVLKSYRDSVYAHWEKEIFNNYYQNDFIENNKLNFSVFVELSKICFDCFSEMLNLLNEEPYIRSFPQKTKIEHFIKKFRI